MMCQSIWCRRNKCRVNEVVAPLAKISDLANQHLQEFQQQQGKPSMKQTPKKTIWKPPDPSTFKTNFYGAVFEDLGAASIGAVVCNSVGEFKAALFEITPLPSLIVALETLATRRVVHFVQELDLQGSIFEGDSELSISAIKNQCFHHPSCGHLIKDIIVFSQFYSELFFLSYTSVRQHFGTYFS